MWCLCWKPFLGGNTALWNHPSPTHPPGDSSCPPWAGLGVSRTWLCCDTRNSSKPQARKKHCSRIKCFVVGPQSDHTGERKQRRVWWLIFFFSLWSILGNQIRGTPQHCKGEFGALALEEAPSKTPAACEHRENTFLLQIGRSEMTFRFCRMFTLGENSLVLNGYSPGVCGGSWGCVNVRVWSGVCACVLYMWVSAHVCECVGVLYAWEGCECVGVYMWVRVWVCGHVCYACMCLSIIKYHRLGAYK